MFVNLVFILGISKLFNYSHYFFRIGNLLVLNPCAAQMALIDSQVMSFSRCQIPRFFLFLRDQYPFSSVVVFCISCLGHGCVLSFRLVSWLQNCSKHTEKHPSGALQFLRLVRARTISRYASSVACLDISENVLYRELTFKSGTSFLGSLLSFLYFPSGMS